MQEQVFWQAVSDRNKEYDGVFVYAVRSTGIYCRPSCPSRRPRREQVQFFDRPAAAEQAGFRACRRCHPQKATVEDPNLRLVEQMCRYLIEREDRAPTLDELSQQFHMSPYHLQRTFKRIIGVTPRQYAAAQRADRLKAHLKERKTVTEAIYEAGYQSSSSAYGQSSGQLGMTPAAYQRGGQGTAVTYTITSCPLGYLLVAATPKGICAVRLGDSEAELTTTLAGEFSSATIQRSDETLLPWVSTLQDYLHGGHPQMDLPLDIRATAFQHRVWTALQQIPYGITRSYSQVAEAIGQPTAARAVARACAANPVAIVIPCHRVIRGTGHLGGYRWGLERKQALLTSEISA